MLELRDITKRFGDVLANDRVSLAVEPGTIHAIVGENGAGKSTAMRIAYGFYARRLRRGRWWTARPRRLASPHDAIALGIGMVHQHFMLVETMTVAENIVLGRRAGLAAGARPRGRRGARPRAVRGVRARRSTRTPAIETLSVGQQQRVELLKALYREARLLILDEPTAVLTPQEVAELFRILRRHARAGEDGRDHHPQALGGAGDLRRGDGDARRPRGGRTVKTGETNAAELARLMVGRDVLLRVVKPEAKPGGAVLERARAAP